jgi:2-polyprenyl-6-methoxyphenol hydroxylase-like FAD-dependent oxidoreductase
MLTFTRPFLDWHIRRRLQRRPNVAVVEGARVKGFTAGSAAMRVTGVRVVHKKAGGAVDTREADLVVAATGRRGQASEWLAELGYQRPKTEEVDPHLGYASALFHPSPGFSRSWKWKALLLLGRPPDATRGGALLPVEDGRWLVTLVGVGGDCPQTSYDGFLNFAASLRSPLLFQALEEAEPLSPIRGNRSTKNTLHHYHTLPRWPNGLVVIGDALCSLNPIHAQGISVSALQAMELGKCLQGRDRLNHLARECQRRLYLETRTPWLLATGDDLSWPTTTGTETSLSTRMVHFYMDQVASLAVTSREVDRVILEVSHLLKSPLALFRPDIFGRVLLKPFRPDRPVADSPLPGADWMVT